MMLAASETPTPGTPLVWGPCWRFAVEIGTPELPRLEHAFCAGLGLAPIARDPGFVMLASDDLVVAVCLRAAVTDTPARPVGPVSLMLMVTNAQDVAARLQRLGVEPQRGTADGQADAAVFELAPGVKLTIFECPT